MTQKDRGTRDAGSRKRSASGTNRRRTRKARSIRRLTIFALVGALVLAGLVVVILSSSRPVKDEMIYPMQYEALIRTASAENGLDPALTAAVILAESSYRPEAVSEVNAQGLMQLLPSTAEWVAGKFDETYTEGILFDPNTNLRYGCWYLGYLVRRFDGDLNCAIAAYHAGQGTVDGWLKDPECSPDGKTLQHIPSSATETYVKRVLKYYEEYQKLYPSKG